MKKPQTDPVIDEIREVRHQISARFDHDPARLVALLAATSPAADTDNFMELSKFEREEPSALRAASEPPC